MRCTQRTKILFFGIIMLLIGCNTEPTTIVEPVDSFSQPYSLSSIWNRQVPTNAEFIDVQDAIWGDLAQAPTSVYPDLIGVYYVDPSQPLTNFRLTQIGRASCRERV